MNHLWQKSPEGGLTTTQKWRCPWCGWRMDLGWDPELGYRSLYTRGDEGPWTLERPACRAATGWDANGSEAT